MTELRAADVALTSLPSGRRSIRWSFLQLGISAVATLLVASIVTFAATTFNGNDPARAALGRTITQEELDLFRKQQGLDQPAAKRYWIWMKHAAAGDWGFSLNTRQPTTDLVVPRAGRSAILAVIALLLALPVAFLVGAIAARKPGGLIDNILSTGTLFIIGLPEFVVGLLLLYLLAVWLNLLPPDSTGIAFGSLSRKVEAYVLPSLTLAILLTPYMARMIRVSVREVLATPYIQAALLRGVTGGRLFFRHVLPNAVGPVVNVIALSLAEVLVGVVIVENVFGFPGLGQLTVLAVSTSDIAVIQICALLAAASFVVLNFTADSVLILLNPRLRRRQS